MFVGAGWSHSSTPLSLPSSRSNIYVSKSNAKTKIFTFKTNPNPFHLYITYSSPLSTFFTPSCEPKHESKTFFSCHSSSLRASSSSSSSVGSAEHFFEPNTNIQFEMRLIIPGCSNPLSLLGTGYLERVFSIFSEKVYAVGFYANTSSIQNSNIWKERRQGASLFHSIYQAPIEKSLQIVMVREIHGNTFWGALKNTISARIKSPTRVDQTAISTFERIFQERSLKEGTVVFLTWLHPSKMLLRITSNGSDSIVDATIESRTINLALFDIFFGDVPISPSLKATVYKELTKILN